MTTDYNKQATDFLQATNTTLEVKEANPQKPAQWGSGEDKTAHKHINYTVTIKNKKHFYTFDFWGSINDWEKVQLAEYRNDFSGSENKTKLRKFLKDNNILATQYQTKKDIENSVKEIVKPKAYDILACLSPMYEDTFEDFCNTYGYDTDSRTAEDTYKRCIEQDRQLHKLFTHEELEQLAEIN